MPTPYIRALLAFVISPCCSSSMTSFWSSQNNSTKSAPRSRAALWHSQLWIVGAYAHSFFFWLDFNGSLYSYQFWRCSPQIAQCPLILKKRGNIFSFSIPHINILAYFARAHWCYHQEQRYNHHGNNNKASPNVVLLGASDPSHFHSRHSHVLILFHIACQFFFSYSGCSREAINQDQRWWS